MSAAIAVLMVDLQRRLRAAYDEADEAHAEAALIREQRGIVLEQIHEAGKRITRQDQRIRALCEENRALRAQVAEWQRVAA